jgi:hypothetical protein
MTRGSEFRTPHPAMKMPPPLAPSSPPPLTVTPLRVNVPPLVTSKIRKSGMPSVLLRAIVPPTI